MSTMKRVLNKLLCGNYDCCRNCMFNGNCEGDRNDACWYDDVDLIDTYGITHIYVEDEKSSE